MTPIPTTPEQWAAIVPNETDAALSEAWNRVPFLTAGEQELAAASRIAEHERCVQRLADHLCNAEFHTRLPDEPCGTCRVEARRILEDR